jgi:hypothetical protein
MTNEAREDNKFIRLEGMAWMRVFSAGQCLMAPTKMFRVTHKRCREVLREELGFCPKGKPGAAKDNGWREGGEEAILTWLGCVYKETYKACAGAITPGDITLLVVKS